MKKWLKPSFFGHGLGLPVGTQKKGAALFLAQGFDAPAGNPRPGGEPG
jgi:hypothetical protein